MENYFAIYCVSSGYGSEYRLGPSSHICQGRADRHEKTDADPVGVYSGDASRKCFVRGFVPFLQQGPEAHKSPVLGPERILPVAEAPGEGSIPLAA